MSDSIDEVLKSSLWTVDFPKARNTRWHQTLNELANHIGQATAISLGYGQTKGPVWLELESRPGSVQVRIRGTGEAEEVVLDARMEAAPH